MLIIDLWAGFGGTVLALLALGAQVIVVSAEHDGEVSQVTSRTMPNAVQVEKVEHIRGADLIPVLKRRNVSVVLIGGGAPCQGNSGLNVNSRGMEDPRTQGAIHIKRIEDELKGALKEHGMEAPPIGTWLEST